MCMVWMHFKILVLYKYHPVKRNFKTRAGVFQTLSLNFDLSRQSSGVIKIASTQVLTWVNKQFGVERKRKFHLACKGIAQLYILLYLCLCANCLGSRFLWCRRGIISARRAMGDVQNLAKIWIGKDSNPCATKKKFCFSRKRAHHDNTLCPERLI